MPAVLPFWAGNGSNVAHVADAACIVDGACVLNPICVTERPASRTNPRCGATRIVDATSILLKKALEGGLFRVNNIE